MDTPLVAAHLESVRLGAFKSYRDQELSLRPVTLLVGRNASGKSNALDALSLLSLLAEGRDVSDLERDDLEVAGLRGGVSGAAPFGESPLRVGCTVAGEGGRATLDVEIDTAGPPEIISESLTLHDGDGDKALIQSARTAPGSRIADVKVYSGRHPKSYQLLSSRLASAQALGKVAGDTKARKLVLEICERVVDVLQGVFVLDPVPGRMREYVRIGSAPDRSGSKLSAIIHSLQGDPHAWGRLTELVRSLVGASVDVTFAEAKLPDARIVDVMVALRESMGERRFTTDARLMSDGTLRYLSIVSSLLHLRASGTGGRTLVVEEIENGLFPSQASRVLDLLRDEATDQGVQLVATTHSPALLDALRPADHAGVVICDRGPDGLSQLRRLTEHPRYVEIAGAGAIGRAVTQGELERAPTDRVASVSELFGT